MLKDILVIVFYIRGILIYFNKNFLLNKLNKKKQNKYTLQNKI